MEIGTSTGWNVSNYSEEYENWPKIFEEVMKNCQKKSRKINKNVKEEKIYYNTRKHIEKYEDVPGILEKIVKKFKNWQKVYEFYENIRKIDDKMWKFAWSVKYVEKLFKITKNLQKFYEKMSNKLSSQEICR